MKSDIKPLEQMIREIPELKSIKSLSNTLAIDDKEYTIKDNPDNGILIPQYVPKTIDEEDDALLKLMEWLKRPDVKNSTDVRNLDKKNIFN